MTDRTGTSWRMAWMVLAALAIPAILISLFVLPDSSGAARLPTSAAVESMPVTLASDDTIVVAADSPLSRRLKVEEVTSRQITSPLLTVTGSVIARVGSGAEAAEERWQFNSAELATAYADLLRSRADVDFSEARLKKTRELVEAQESHFQSVVKRLEEVAGTGVAQKDLTAAKAALLQAQLQGEKDIYAEESGLRVAKQERASHERELVQLGIEPVVLARAREGMVLIAANVPESKIGLVREQQACEARFYGFPETLYSAHVEHLVSILNSERRTLRVLFDLTDDKEQLRPGMFADVFLGTESRPALLISTDALIHIGRSDYVLRQTGEGRYALVKVDVAEPEGDVAEVIHGLSAGDRVVTGGAVLLKPLAVQALNRHPAS
jgi:membrane fusion protein, heavy metal efflux system